MEEIITKVFTIGNELGLHARAAASFVKVVNRFKSKVSVKKDSVTVNGKSIMGVLMLAAAKGSKIEVTATGDDASILIKEVEKLILNNFGE
jgi:phosphocarrier protein